MNIGKTKGYSSCCQNLVECICLHGKVLLVTVFVCCFARIQSWAQNLKVHLNFGRCVPMQTGQESVCCCAIPKSYETIPPAMSYRQMKRILPLWAKIQLLLRQILISILKMKAGVRKYECILLWAFFWGGGCGREQTPCIDWCNSNGYGFRASLVWKWLLTWVRSENGNWFGGDSYVLSVLKMGRKNCTSCSQDG